MFQSAAYNLAETADLRNRTLQAGQDCAQQFRELLFAILQGNAMDAKHTLPPISRKIAQCVTELVAVAELLKGKYLPPYLNQVLSGVLESKYFCNLQEPIGLIQMIRQL